ncbi:MAG TPA: phosphoethanolamine--lipid A transferase [Candidatus Acidoferrum sp.]|nr:phosphoethanolamine--lipid A transferase [Candidatus Acidoferrum sp.]
MEPLLRYLLNPLIGIHRLILLISAVFVLFFNRSFFHNLHDLYGNDLHGFLFMASLALMVFGFHVLLLCVLCFRYTTKAILSLLFVGGAAAAYFMGRFNIVVDATMLTNVFQTNPREAGDLLGTGLMLQLALMGVVPSLWLWRVRIYYPRWTRELRNRLLLMGGTIVLWLASALPFTADYASYFREHKLLRFYANPATFVYSGVRMTWDHFNAFDTSVRKTIGLEAKRMAQGTRRNLVILVVGEAARADHFSLNGYGRKTNPLLAAQDVISFTNVVSCGTATAYSVPCMFSLSDRTDFDLRDAATTENVLDVLKHAGVAVLWRDNNSDSKGVAKAVEFQDFQHSPPNTACDVECRDVGMLDGLDDWIAAHPTGDIAIVLHQMGMHGPSYFKRYPPEYARFQPTCLTKQLEQCRPEEIVNSYDNAILYTDFFLSETINFLRKHDDFATAMFYMSDHGESLGENGIYLHGMPFLLAPEAQKHVAALLWFGPHYPVDRALLKQRIAHEYSHDEYFHTVLSLLQIATPEYNAAKDWLAGAHPKQ